MTDKSLTGSDRLVLPSEKNSNNLFARGDLWFWQCKYKDAREYFEMVLKQPTLSPLELARCYNSLGAINRELQNYDEALVNYHRQLDVLREIADLGKTTSGIVKCYTSIGKIYWLKKDCVQAIHWYQQALDAIPAIISDSDLTSEIYKGLANLYTKTHDFELAKLYFTEALAIDRTRLRDDHPKLGQTYANMGAMYCALNDYEQALIHFSMAHETWQKSLSPTHIYVESMTKTIDQVQSKLIEISEQDSTCPELRDIKSDPRLDQDTSFLRIPAAEGRISPSSDRSDGDSGICPPSNWDGEVPDDPLSVSLHYRSIEPVAKQGSDDNDYDEASQHTRENYLSKYHCCLEDYHIIIVADDSGSMQTSIDGTDKTRWDELYDFVKILLKYGGIYNPSGVDLYFLNRPPMLNITDVGDVEQQFNIFPCGYTPLAQALRHIFQLSAKRQDTDRKLLVLVATDGAPTDDRGNIDIDELRHVMNNERQAESTFLQFLICTDDQACVEYLRGWDREMLNVGVMDDFRSERKKVQNLYGKDYPFAKDDYITKALLSLILSKSDMLNECIIEDDSDTD